jgi:hypothetical protein
MRGLDDGLACDVGGYLLVARRTGASIPWDAMVTVLTALEAEDHRFFRRVMRGCRRLSNSRPEVDGLDDLLDDGGQAMFDVAFDREERREKQGYVTPAQARAFLQMSRELRLRSDTRPPANPIARAYFRAIDRTTAVDTLGEPDRVAAGSGTAPAAEDYAETVAAVVDVLREAGIVPQQPRALLNGSQERAPRVGRVRMHMQFVFDRDAAAYSTRTEELGYLANTIMAGCSIQSRPFAEQEAADAAVAVCNLGLENWPPHWVPGITLRGAAIAGAGTALPDDFLVDHDLVSVFQVGWTVLHTNVAMYAAERLIRILTDLQCHDRETQTGLDALRLEIEKQWQTATPWRARDALEVIAILDMPAWATLLALIDECPVMHAAIAASRGTRTLAVDASAFEFISENSQIASVREFMQSLPDILRP